MNKKSNLLYRTSFPTEKNYILFVKNVEKIIRGSIEYREWITITRDSYGTWKCAILGNTIEQCSIEVHHHPYTLFDIVSIVIYNKKEQFCTFNIAEEVMDLHFNFYIGFIPLTVSIHEQYHNNVITLPKKLIQGNYQKLEQIYEIPEDIKENVCQKLLI